jgi:ABC-type sugar transport system ATPase subunit
MVDIELEQVRRTFGDVVAVDDVTLRIPRGTFTVFLGPSGCGKTTTLNMIAGLEDVSDGRILFDGEEVQDLPPNKRDISVVFQSYALYPNRTVRENIAFPLRMQRVPKAEVAQRVERAAERLGLAPLLDRRPRALSGGQQQRVALARSMVRTPRAFLLDEPLSNLDAKLRAETQFELKELQRELDGTFIHVTHDQAEAMSLADLMVVMNRGTVQQQGTGGEVYARPANLFVARFVGIPAMNVVEGAVSDGRFEGAGWSAPVPAGVPSGPVVLGVRSESLRLVPDAERPVGRVQLSEQIGADVLVAVESDAGKLVARVPVDEAVFTPGQGVGLAVDPRHMHFFDPATEERIRDHERGTVHAVPDEKLTRTAQG